MTTAQNSAAELEHDQTARIEIISLKKTDNAIEATVRIHVWLSRCVSVAKFS